MSGSPAPPTPNSLQSKIVVTVASIISSMSTELAGLRKSTFQGKTSLLFSSFVQQRCHKVHSFIVADENTWGCCSSLNSVAMHWCCCWLRLLLPPPSFITPLQFKVIKVSFFITYSTSGSKSLASLYEEETPAVLFHCWRCCTSWGAISHANADLDANGGSWHFQFVPTQSFSDAVKWLYTQSGEENFWTGMIFNLCY